MNFDVFNFDRRVASGIKACGYVTPTPIQQRAITPVLEGRDVMGLAQTGTGKTAAFALPILERLLVAGYKGHGPIRALVLAPTRELALQIHENFMALGKHTGIKSAAVFGGVKMNPQIKAARKASVIVACPGRLLDLLNQRVIRLDHVETLVLDEADRMMDMGFMPDVNRIIDQLPGQRQNLLFSATMPRDIRALADKILHDPETVQVANTAPAKAVSHAFYPVRHHLKPELVMALLDKLDHESVLIFTRTKHRAKTLARKLDRQGYRSTFLQGNMTQNQRQRALDGFRRGTYNVMVATDIAARGIDCDKISHVINMDAPDGAETYTHRIGRTGRAGRSGEALMLVTREDQYLMRKIERVVGERIPLEHLEDFDYDQAPRPHVAQPHQRPYPAKKRNSGGSYQNRSAKGGNRRPRRRKESAAA